ncbi:MAG: hypothetical protein GXY83_30740 [Rhodopirellula sp.]|nr:hypothetical protein [Rhodopirellula sp.]
MRFRLPATLLILLMWAGCGTTKWSDTARTATEQLLISDAMDRAVSQLDMRALAGKEIFIDEAPLKSIVDTAYLLSTLRQHLLASGAILKEKKDEAEYVVEVRAGAVGTDRHDVLFGVPATNIPSVALVPGVPSSIPEIPLMKKTEQHGVTKIAVFAYNRKTGRPVWQSGVVPGESKAKDFWVFGAGPFQRGSIYEGTEFAGGKLNIPLVDLNKKRQEDREAISVADEAYFVEPEEESEQQVAQQPANKVSQAEPEKSPPKEKQPAAAAVPAEKPPVVQAGHTAEPSKPATAAPAAAPQVAAAPIASSPDDSQTSSEPIQVPLINSPPVMSPPPEIVGPSPPIAPSTPLPAFRPAGTVLPLPPVEPAPDETTSESMLDRLLRFGR